MICFLLVLSCSGKDNIIKKQINLHAEFSDYFRHSLIEASKTIDKNAEDIKQNYSLSYCPEKYMVSEKSSIYIPKSAVVDAHLCNFLRATSIVEDGWLRSYKNNKFISWLYVYDANSKIVKIHPATNPISMFGEDLIFDTFHFYSGAVSSYPKGSWAKPKEDINGTGTILIYSKAVQLQNKPSKAVVAVDIRIKHFLDKYINAIVNFSEAQNINYLFVISYIKKDKDIILVNDFATNPIKWNAMIKGKIVKKWLKDSLIKQLSDLENEAVRSQGKPVYHTIIINDIKMDCSLSSINEEINMYTLFCSDI